MIGSAILLSNFIEGNMKQFIIPVYQRNYDWLIDNCEQLFNDLVKLSKQHKQTHFFGSIVTASADAYGRNRLVIDGQQRITTISLLLLAGIKAVKDGKLLVSNEARLNEAYEMFLLAKFSSADRKIKLVPIESDRIAYDLIFDNAEDKFIAESKVTRNFMYFYGLLTKTPQEFSFDDLLNTIERLQIITIELDNNDDAQLIFESLNSTGLALTEADKIRNYLLMSLSPEEQQQCFKDYWQKIEQATDNEPTMFLRDYLTIRQQRQRHVRLPYMYQEWKKYMEVKDRKEELAQMLDYAKYYRQVTKSQLSTPRLSKKMSHICNIDTDVVNVFFMQFLKYADENGLQEDEVYKAIYEDYSNFNSENYVYDINYCGPTLTASGALSRIKLFFGSNKIRYMNAKEAFLYMGFKEKHYQQVKKYNLLSDRQLIFIMGNSIVVNVLEAIFSTLKFEGENNE